MDEMSSGGGPVADGDAPALPPLKTDPRFGYFPWWPEDGDAWVHPEDIETARRSIPGPRVWRLEQADTAPAADAMVTLVYGETRLRVRPRLWRETPAPELAIGDLVEVLPHGMQNDPITGRVREVHWDDHARAVRYQVDAAERVRGTWFGAADLKPIQATKAEPLMRIEPSHDNRVVDQMLEGLDVDKHHAPGG